VINPAIELAGPPIIIELAGPPIIIELAWPRNVIPIKPHHQAPKVRGTPFGGSLRTDKLAWPRNCFGGALLLIKQHLGSDIAEKLKNLLHLNLK